MRTHARWLWGVAAGAGLGLACQVGESEPFANSLAPTSASDSSPETDTDVTGPSTDTEVDDDDTATSVDPSASTGTTSEVTTATTMPPEDCPLGEVPCGVLCVDTQNDPGNCGGCGVSCVVANASAMCIAGGCAMGDCNAGWGDCDGMAANGCEAPLDCTAGSTCATSCGSQGTTSCDGCEASCMAPAETCNAIDDDCNGQCDEGAMAGCRESVHRANGPNGHYYTNVLAETSQDGRSLEAADYWWMYTQEHSGTRELYRCEIGAGSGRFFLTTSSTCEGAGPVDDVLGFLMSEQSCGSIPLYRLYNGRHFYTTSSTERDNAINNLGFASEGVTGYVWPDP